MSSVGKGGGNGNGGGDHVVDVRFLCYHVCVCVRMCVRMCVCVYARASFAVLEIMYHV